MSNTANHHLITPIQREHQKRNSHSKVDPTDPYNFDVRFVSNQLLQYEDALTEIQSGCKRTCWLWFVLPTQPHLNKLGQEVGSPTNQHFALRSDEEVVAYLQFPERKGIHLRTNYLRMVQAILEQLQPPESKQSPQEPPVTMLRLFGYLDAPKVESSLRLFHRIITTSASFKTPEDNDTGSSSVVADQEEEFQQLATLCQKVLDLILLEKQQREIVHVVRTASKRKEYRHVMTM